MRLWTVHPKYLDPKGLVALWREALLARTVLRGETVGYRQHPQLSRFRAHPAPLQAIDAYLSVVFAESVIRGYAFDSRKVGTVWVGNPMVATTGQLAYEWGHLRKKLAVRSQEWLQQRCPLNDRPEAHPLFTLIDGPVEPWESVPR